MAILKGLPIFRFHKDKGDSEENFHRPLSPESVSRAARNLRFSFVLPRRLAGMGVPGIHGDPREEVAFLKENGITAFVNLTGLEYAHPIFVEAFSIHSFPIPNLAPPSVSQVDGIYALYQGLETGGAMAVHCQGGLGRAGAVLACLMGRENHLSGEAAIRKIRKQRRYSIESSSQEDFVLAYLDR